MNSYGKSGVKKGDCSLSGSGAGLGCGAGHMCMSGSSGVGCDGASSLWGCDRGLAV